MAKYYDVIIVGAGPAGSMAAIKLARAGLNVCLLERGKYPGAKNMFGGLLHNTPVLNEMLPSFWERAPLERHVYKKVLAFMTENSAICLTFENENFEKPPYNGYTVFRPVFDSWLAGEAVKEGALLLCDCTAEDLITKDGRVIGVTVKGREGELRGNIVIAADGVLSFMAEKAGLRRDFRARDMGVGIKLLLGLPEAGVYRQPFPGPGLAVRIVGAVTPQNVALLQEADAIVRQEIEDAGLGRQVWQYFAILTPVKSVGVMGDGRTYENVVGVRAVVSEDAMTADWARLPYDLLARMSNRIVNEVSGVNRVVYDISSKPPATIEWE